MSENSKPTLQSKLKTAQAILLSSGSLSARLDAFILAELVLQKNRAWVLTNLNYLLPANQMQKFDLLIAKRAARMPIAYLTGKKEFCGRDFIVNQDVLIPRPETEQIIEEIINIKNTKNLLDVGTGSGAIAITAALQTTLQVDACDISLKALGVAKQNAKNLGAHINFFKSDLLSGATKKYDIIAANLPYVDESWQRSPETNFEPALALFAEDFGLALIKKLLDQAPKYLNAHGYVLLEADPRQHKHIVELARLNFKKILINNFSILLKFSR